MLLLGSQIGLGLPATRAFYDFGVTTRGMLKFYDAGNLGNDVETIDLKVNVGDMPLVFDQLDYQIRKYDSGAIDDLNDLAWFAIFIWAMISSAGIFAQFTGIPLCTFGVIVLVATCFASYASGYRTVQGVSFEEDLHHLEYYIDRCIRSVDSALLAENGKVIVQVSEQGRRTVLIDIVVEFVLSSDFVVEYHIGLSSQRKERFIVVTPADSLDRVYAKFKKIPTVQSANWTLEQITTQSGVIIRIVNLESKLSISDRASFVITPDHVENNILLTQEILTEIGKILESISNQ